MSPQDKMDPDGIRNDGVSYEAAASHLHIYEDNRQKLTDFKEPVLLHSGNPHQYLYFANFDGTDNDKIHDPEHKTNVGLISDQLEALEDAGNNQIGSGYVAGVGTQQGRPVAKLFDDVSGVSVNERAEEMYKQFIEQAKRWNDRDPDAQISVASLSFSRGGESNAIFTRMVEERGIQDPSGAVYAFNKHGEIEHVEYSNPPLVPPHQVAQAVAMFDPVGTGQAMGEDRRLPPSVISGIQLIALDERRTLFPSDHIIDPGLTLDGRFAGLYVPGVHCDVGGSYFRDGLSSRSGNFVIDYLNGLSDKPILKNLEESADPRLNVIHHSVEGKWLYEMGYRIDRTKPEGFNETLVHPRDLTRVPDPNNAEPRNEALSSRFERQTMPNGPLRNAVATVESAKSEMDDWIDRAYAASQNPDGSVWDQMQHQVAQHFRQSPAGQVFQQDASALNQGWDNQLQAQQAQVAAQQAAQQDMQNTQQPSQGPGR